MLAKFKSVFVGLLANLLFGVFAFIIDRFFSFTVSSNYFIHVGGTLVLTLGGLAFLQILQAEYTKIKTWEFHGLFSILFLTGCLDMFATMGFFTSPKDWIFPNYIHSDDEILESVWAQTDAMLDAFIMQPLNYIALYKIYNGQSWRSLGLFNAAIFLVMIIVYIIELATTTAKVSLLSQFLYFYVPYITVVFFIILAQPRSFTFRAGSKNQNFNSQASSLDFLTLALMISTIVIYFAKFLVSTGSTGGLLELFEETDPMLLFLDIKDGVSPGVIHMWLCVVTVVPSLALGISYMVGGGKKPTYLWEVGVLQTAIIVMTQSYAIMGSFHWQVPADLKVDMYDTLFWIVNLIPVLATTLYLDYLSRDRVKLSGGVKKNK